MAIPPQVVCVLGMHRSGTSPISRIVNLLGFSLGPSDHLMEPNEANPRGFWEHQGLTNLNDEILARLGGSWHEPPDFPPGWEKSSVLADLRQKARALIDADFDRTPAWSWKDPRACLTLPFWQHLLPPMHYVITVRSPLEVAQSLESRDKFPFTKGIALWLRHLQGILEHSSGHPRLFLFYEDLLQDSSFEVGRLSRFLAIDDVWDRQDIRREIESSIEADLRHHRTSLVDVADEPRLVFAAKALYLVLRLTAFRHSPGSVSDVQWQGLIDHFAAYAAQADREAKVLASQLARLNGDIAEKGAHILRLADDAERWARDAETFRLAAQDARARADQQDQRATHTAEELARLQAVVASGLAHESHSRALERLLDERDATLQTVFQSRSWRLTARFRTIGTRARHLRRRARAALGAIKRRAKSIATHLSKHPLSRGPLAPRLEISLPCADGPTDWADYPAVRDRIATISRNALRPVPPLPRPLISLGKTDLREAAARVVLPSCLSSPEVSILIPAFNNLQYTLECLLSVSTHTSTRVSFEVIVADDASTDDTREVLAHIPNLRLTSNPSNLGFLRTCNKVATLARGKYLLFLNNDAQVTAGWLEPMLRILSEHADVGAVGPMLLYPDGRLQEAGARLRRDGTVEMIGLLDAPATPRFSYQRDVEFCSAVCLVVAASTFAHLGGFDERYAPAYYEDVDLSIRLRRLGLRIVYCPDSLVVHHLSASADEQHSRYKSQCIVRNRQTLRLHWQEYIDRADDVRVIAFYLPQFHPIPENDTWWGKGFTEWRNVTKARPNFEGHYQPRLPADLGYYDLRVPDIMAEQARLAQRYGVSGFCFYYYWFNGKRLLDLPLERMLATRRPDMPFCLCWANENWTRRWDGRDHEPLIEQHHSDEDDEAVIRDLARYFRDPRYIRVRGRPVILVYRVPLFPDFARTARTWRRVCEDQGIGDIYVAMVESFELANADISPADYGCDASVEFPPHGMANLLRPVAHSVINPSFRGSVGDYHELAIRFATRPYPGYTRLCTVMPGWDNTPRRQNDSLSFEQATPGAFQAWLEAAMERTKQQCCGDERLLFVNAWNEWAEGAYLEPDQRYGHAYLEAVLNARDASMLITPGATPPS